MMIKKNDAQSGKKIRRWRKRKNILSDKLAEREIKCPSLDNEMYNYWYKKKLERQKNNKEMVNRKTKKKGNRKMRLRKTRNN